MERREVQAQSASEEIRPEQQGQNGKFSVQTTDRPTGRIVYPAEQARQGEIVLRRPWQLVVFIGGLAGCVLLVLILWFWMAAS